MLILSVEEADCPEDADLLHKRGILYAPDYVVNAGAAVAIPLIDAGDLAEDQVRESVQRIGNSLERMFAEAKEYDESPVHAAQRLVRQRLESAPKKLP